MTSDNLAKQPPSPRATAEFSVGSEPADGRKGARPRWVPVAVNALPGILAGAQLAGLLLFLNPAIPFSWLKFLQTTAVLGVLLGGSSALLLGLVTWKNPWFAWRLLPWALVVVLGATAAVDWLQASFLAFYTPPGINVRLIKAAIGLTIAAVVLFYTALRHTFPPRPYGKKSIALFVFLALASVYLLGERRGAFQPPVESIPLPSLVELEDGASLFVVGIEGATLDAILPLVQEGQLPFFAQMIEGGVHGRLEPLAPTLRTAVWTSLATGKYPYKHSILSERPLRAEFLEGKPTLALTPWGLPLPARYLPGFRQARPDATFRRALALWEIYARLDFATGVVSWPSIYPVTETSAFSFSERYFAGNFSAVAALPPELAERGVLFQVGLSELGPATANEFDGAPQDVLSALAGDVWRESLSQFLLEQRRDLQRTFLLLPGLGEVSRRYLGGFAAFHLEGIRNDKRRLAAQLITAYYRHLDSFLADLWSREEGAKLLAVVSPFGVQSPEGWRRVWHSMTGRSNEGTYTPPDDGVFFLFGEGVRSGHFLERAQLLDVAPTLLYATKLPIGRDLDGRVLADAFDSQFLAQTPLTFVPSYETLVGRPPSLTDDATAPEPTAASE